MNENQDTVPPETKFFSSCSSVKLNKFFASKMQYWNRHRINVSIPKGEIEKKKGQVLSKSKPNKANIIKS